MSRNIITPEMLSTLHNPMASGVLIYNRPTNEYLLLKRRESATVYGGHWAIPAGTADVNHFESAEECARRETLEEIGYEIPDNAQLKLLDRYVSNGLVFFVFLHTIDKKFFLRLCKEHTEGKWFSPSNLPSNVTPEVLDSISRISIV
jgi:8-oxo-dGTP pyrophosphatase MutT (NUDIX family)